MTFSQTWEAIRAAIREELLETPMARSIMRKSGFRPSVAALLSTARILSLEGSRRVCFTTGTPYPGDSSNWVTQEGLYAWGANTNNNFGQREAFLVSYAVTPMRTGQSITDVLELTSHFNGTAILRSDGTVWITGPPDAGFPNLDAFSELADSEDTVGLASYFHFVAPTSGNYYLLKSDGTVWAIGGNLAGQGPALVPPVSWAPTTTQLYQMPSGATEVSDVLEIEACSDRICYRKSSGVVGVWRTNVADPDYPTGVPAGIVKLAGGASVLLALTEDGEIWATGGNSHGEYGNGTTSLATGLDAWHLTDGTGEAWTDIAASGFACYAINASGELYSWGDGLDISGRGSAAPEAHTPTQITSPYMDGWTSVHGNYNAIVGMAIFEDGCIHIWGRNDSGQLGQGRFGFPGVGEPIPLLVSRPTFPLA